MDRKLALDPTPAGLIAGRSISDMWDQEMARIRKRHFAHAGLICQFCDEAQSEPKRIHGHEVWEFPNKYLVRLKEIVFICDSCHDAVHLERTSYVCGSARAQRAKDRYCRINKITAKGLEADFKVMIFRSKELRVLYGLGTTPLPAIHYGPYQTAIDACEKRKRTGVEDDSDFEMYPDHECPWDVGHAD
jgi:hypothetical protein